MLELKHIGKDYDGVTVLRDISLSIWDGEIVSILGTSGCGKTTLLNLILGLTEADRGHARHTDFIFAVCGEELGMVGCLALLLLLALVILRCLWVARNASSPFHAYVAVGMAGMLIIQIAANVGMCLFIFPVMGLTLPFVSYGGSSILTLYAAMGIVSSIKARALPSWLRDRAIQ